MTERQRQIVQNVDAHRQQILEAERWLWAHPQTGYTEWDAHGYLAEKFASLGYTLHCAGDIPGFYADIETGKPGPKLCILGELDALDIANHPESVNGMAHCCGHHAQGAALLGVAAALQAPGALDGLCGSIRLMAVPAEEMIQLAFREELRKKGVIHYLGGKVEFLYRGYFDGVDLALMVHGGNCGKNIDFSCGLGSNGCVAKTIRYKGKSAHAGGAPQNGVNAQYAAMLGLQACNALRETFPDGDSIRFHPIMMGVNCAVNIIPDEMRIESYVRARTIEAIVRENKKINRAPRRWRSGHGRGRGAARPARLFPGIPRSCLHEAGGTVLLRPGRGGTRVLQRHGLEHGFFGFWRSHRHHAWRAVHGHRRCGHGTRH